MEASKVSSPKSNTLLTKVQQSCQYLQNYLAGCPYARKMVGLSVSALYIFGLFDITTLLFVLHVPLFMFTTREIIRHHSLRQRGMESTVNFYRLLTYWMALMAINITYRIFHTMLSYILPFGLGGLLANTLFIGLLAYTIKELAETSESINEIFPYVRYQSSDKSNDSQAVKNNDSQVVGSTDKSNKPVTLFDKLIDYTINFYNINIKFNDMALKMALRGNLYLVNMINEGYSIGLEFFSFRIQQLTTFATNVLPTLMARFGKSNTVNSTNSQVELVDNHIPKVSQ